MSVGFRLVVLCPWVKFYDNGDNKLGENPDSKITFFFQLFAAM
jgi:hypothetical protein